MQHWECGTCWYQSRSVPFVGLASELRHRAVFLLANTEILFGITVCRNIPILIHLGSFLGKKKKRCSGISQQFRWKYRGVRGNLSWF